MFVENTITTSGGEHASGGPRRPADHAGAFVKVARDCSVSGEPGAPHDQT